jgi:pilus assembly protein CpaB
MSKKFLIALLCSFAISCCGTLILARKVSAKARRKEPVVRYASAKKPIDVGEIIKPEDLTYLEWPANKAIEGAFTRLEDVTGRSSVYPIGNGQIILDKYLAAPGAGIGLTTRIKDGMRAVALKSDDVIGVAGFLFPGSHVDVLVTYHSVQTPDPVTTTVVQDAQVVAVGHQIQPDPDGKAASVNVVTVLVQPADAEKLVLASTQGSVYFALRNGGDHAQPASQAVQLSSLAPRQQSPERTSGSRERKAHAAATDNYVIETIAGDKHSSVSF